MLDKIVSELLCDILRWLKTKDIVAAALTCKRIYEICKESRNVFNRYCCYSKGIEKRVYFGSIRAINLWKCEENLMEVMKDINRFKNIYELRITHRTIEEGLNMEIFDDLGDHITYLYICTYHVDTKIIDALLVKDTIETLIFTYPVDMIDDNAELETRKLGKSYRRLTIMDIRLESKRYDIKLKPVNGECGLEIFEYPETNIQIKYLREILHDSIGTLRHLFIDNYEMTEIWDEIEKCNSLVSLRIYDTTREDDYLTEKYIRKIPSCIEIIVINYIDEIKYDTFSRFKNLKFLDLNNKNSHMVTTTIDININDLKGLQYLCIGENILKSPFIKLGDFFMLKELKVLIVKCPKVWSLKNSDIKIHKTVEDLADIYGIRELTSDTFPLLKLLVINGDIWEKYNIFNAPYRAKIHKYKKTYNINTYYQICEGV
jgi:hypothetical protein